MLYLRAGLIIVYIYIFQRALVSDETFERIMSQPRVLAGQLFDTDVQVPVGSLLQVQALAEVPDALRQAEMAPARGQSMVVSVCRVSDDGDITEVFLTVVTNVQRARIVVNASQIFPDAPDGFKIGIVRDYPAFLFPPNATQSHWVQASRLSLKFYSSLRLELHQQTRSCVQSKRGTSMGSPTSR